MGLLYELVGPPAVQRYGEVFPSQEKAGSSSKGTGGASSGSGVLVATACLHEDGGRYAEYERIDALLFEVSSDSIFYVQFIAHK